MADSNLLLGKTVTANSSVAPYLPGRAVNGIKSSLSDRWLSCDGGSGDLNDWLLADLGTNYLLSRWTVQLLPSLGWPASYGMSDFLLQASGDGRSWTVLDTVSGNAAATVDRNLSDTRTWRYVRLYMPTGIKAHQQVASVVEWEVYGHLVSPDLASLVVSGGSLAPAFVPGTTAYTQTVATSTASVTVTPTAADSTATIAVNGTTVVSGQNSTPITLGSGSTSISVLVTPVTGAAKTYTVAVSKGQAAAALSGLSLRAGMGVVTPNPVFSPGALSYTVSVGAANNIVVTPSAAGGTTITVNGTAITDTVKSVTVAISAASTVVSIVASAPGATSTTYTLTVSKP